MGTGTTYTARAGDVQQPTYLWKERVSIFFFQESLQPVQLLSYAWTSEFRP